MDLRTSDEHLKQAEGRTSTSAAATKCKISDPFTWHFDNICIPVSISLGLLVGLVIPGNNELSPNYRPISSILGWVYFFCWTISFYPQIIQNYRRKTTIGMASDKILLDLLGYSCLSTYSVAFFYVDYVRQLYQDRNDGNSPKVQINDVCFALHALIMTFVQIGQMSYYDGYKQMPTITCRLGVAVVAAIVLGYLIIICAQPSHHHSGVFDLLDWFYFISFVKIGVTCVKYIPQTMLNYTRKCTVGWNITGVLMDILGSLLSALQLILDCGNTHDWDGITGDFVKFALSFISLIFDFIFMTQHYILYPSTAEYHTLPLLGTHLPEAESINDDKFHYAA
jgi:cystinosin